MSDSSLEGTAALDGISEILCQLLPKGRGFVLVTFSNDPAQEGERDVHITRSTNSRLVLAARKLRKAASLIEKRAAE